MLVVGLAVVVVLCVVTVVVVSGGVCLAVVFTDGIVEILGVVTGTVFVVVVVCL